MDLLRSLLFAKRLKYTPLNHIRVLLKSRKSSGDTVGEDTDFELVFRDRCPDFRTRNLECLSMTSGYLCRPLVSFVRRDLLPLTFTIHIFLFQAKN